MYDPQRGERHDVSNRQLIALSRGVHRAADISAEWRERDSAVVDNMRDRAGNLFNDACECVREKPVESVAIALAASGLIGGLLSSRR